MHHETRSPQELQSLPYIARKKKNVEGDIIIPVWSLWYLKEEYLLIAIRHHHHNNVSSLSSVTTSL